MKSRWVALLLAEATNEDFDRHRVDLLSRAADDAARRRVEAEAADALRLRGRLGERNRRAAELSALNDISNRLTTMRDNTTLLAEVVMQAKTLLSAELAYLGLADDTGRFVIAVANGALTPGLIGLSVERSRGLVGIVLDTAAPAWSEDYSSDERFEHIGRVDYATRSENIRGLLGAPLRDREKVIGALFVATRHETTFTDADVNLLSALAAHAAVAIENARSLEQLNTANTSLTQRTEELEKIVEWDRRFTHAVLNGRGVDQLVGEVATLTGCPTYFFTKAAEIPSALAPQRDRILSLLNGAVVEGEPVADPLPVGSSAAVCRQVAAGGTLLGVIVTMSDVEQVQAVGLILDHAAPALALALAEARAARLATRRARDGFLVDLLTRLPEDLEDEQCQFRLAGLDPHCSYTLAVVQPSGNLAHTAEVLRRAIPDGSLISEHGRRFIAVVPGLDETSVSALMSAANPDATIGIAGPRMGSSQLADAYTEAQQTVHVLHAIGRTGDVETTGGLGIYRILLTHTGRAQLQTMLREKLGSLSDEQARRGVPLIDTLTAYLTYGRRASTAAKVLGVHVNTLTQRLESVDRILGPAWREPERSLDLHVLLRLRSTAAGISEREPSFTGK